MSGEGRRRPVPDDLFGGRLKGCFLLDLEVAAVTDPSPRLRTITFRSPDLMGFEWEPGQDVMLTVPTPGSGDRRGEAARRRYSIRRADAVAGTLDIDVVLHGDGPFAKWAAAATVGDRLDGIGPRGVISLDADAPRHVFVGDESALAVTYAMIEALPAGATAVAVLGSEDGAGPVAGPSVSDADVEIAWVPVAAVADRLRSVEVVDGTVAYVNGERALVRQATEVLQRLGVAPDSIYGKAYWRRDRANAAHGEPPKD